MNYSENKLLSANQLKSWDQFTIQNLPIPSIDLMEKAGKACTDWISNHFPFQSSFHIICGKGNNGGDGLVIAHHLSKLGKKVCVGILPEPKTGSHDFELNFQRISSNTYISYYSLNPDSLQHYLLQEDLIIDALLGNGTNRICEGQLAQLISLLNQTSNTKVSIDLPSGLACDSYLNNTPENTIQSDYTLTFQAPKLSFFFPETGKFAGKWEVLDIGLLPSFLEALTTPYHHTNPVFIGKKLKKRGKFDHKGNFGHALLIGGSPGKIGAMVLAGRSALRSGIGLLTLGIPTGNAPIIHTSLPEAMVMEIDLSSTAHIQALGTYQSVGIGPGLGMAKKTQELVLHVIQNCSAGLVLDADALNTLALHPEWLQYLPPNCILTPHPKEFDRLFGFFPNSFERIEAQVKLSKQYNCIIVLKGGHTSISLPDGELFFNTSGNPGMATGGSGDCLTGILTALLAQSYSPKDASLIGVFLHGLAGDLALQSNSMESLLPEDCIQHLGKAFQQLRLLSSESPTFP
ncbi:MAG: NAD(P)H-hydrate dehydratase [Bacteroidia bacterium]|nr:NAD(P)H-hydrate dehydratase [Bacteroidia bacterium]